MKLLIMVMAMQVQSILICAIAMLKGLVTRINLKIIEKEENYAPLFPNLKFMKRKIFSYLLNAILLVLINGNAYSQIKNDVRKYHSYVNKAENFIIENELDSALVYYKLAFNISEKDSFCFQSDVSNYKELCNKLNVQPVTFNNKRNIINEDINFIDSLFVVDQGIREKRDNFHPNDSIENLITNVDYKNYAVFRKRFPYKLPYLNCSSQNNIVHLNTLLLHFSAIKKVRIDFLEYVSNNIDMATIDPKECMNILSMLFVNVGSDFCPTKLTYINPNDTIDKIKVDTLYIPIISKEMSNLINTNRERYYLKTLADSYKLICFRKNNQNEFIFYGSHTDELVFFSKKEYYHFRPNYIPLNCSK